MTLEVRTVVTLEGSNGWKVYAIDDNLTIDGLKA